LIWRPGPAVLLQPQTPEVPDKEEIFVYINISVADPDPGFNAFSTPGSGMGKNPDPGWINIPS
jgi:hypothetical protein